jgi:hypothetical protein
MVSSYTASRPRNDHRPTMVALLEVLELDADIGDDRIKHVDAQGAPDAGRRHGSLVPVGQAVAFTADTLDGTRLLPAGSDRRGKEQR